MNPNVPRTLRFNEDTEQQLSVLSSLTGTHVSGLIRQFVSEGLAQYQNPEVLKALVAERTSSLQAGLLTLSGQVVSIEVSIENPPETNPEA